MPSECVKKLLLMLKYYTAEEAPINQAANSQFIVEIKNY